MVQNTELDKYLKAKGKYPVVYMPQNPVHRILSEFLNGKKIIKTLGIDIIYSYFGTARFPKAVPQVSGSAESNLYFPELDFWQEYSGIKKLLRRINDRYRIWGLKRVKAVIFENEIMQKRCEQIYRISNTVWIKPSFTKSHVNLPYQIPLAAKSSKFRGLFFCGWQRNKNFMIIPRLAAAFKKASINFHFILTAPPDNSDEHRNFLRLIEKYDAADSISIVGPVKKSEIPSLYEQVDFVFLLSKLESFSNNIIEAWHFKRLLIIADEPWSRSICGDSAVYVSRDDAENIVSGIMTVIKNDAKKIDIIRRGTAILQQYPSIEERTEQEIAYLTYIFNHA
ncbi:MAG: glycosyltransferase [Chitinophagaceae bacterium]